MDGIRVEDPEVGSDLLNNLKRVNKERIVTTWDGQEVGIESFDEPLIARHVERVGSEFFLTTPYGVRRAFDASKLCLDEWDRFHGLVENEISFVFSRSAQFEFFNLLDDYDDESITVGG